MEFETRKKRDRRIEFMIWLDRFFDVLDCIEPRSSYLGVIWIEEYGQETRRLISKSIETICDVFGLVIDGIRWRRLCVIDFRCL